VREELYLRQLKVLYRVVKNVRKKYQGDTSSVVKPFVEDLNRIALEVHTLKEDIERNYEKNTVHSNREDGKQ
jgi:hypothetical protein